MEEGNKSPSSPLSTGKKIFFAAAATSIFLLIAGLGAWVGYRFAVRPLQKQVTYNDRFLTLGGLLEFKDATGELTERQRNNFGDAYTEPEYARQHAHEIAWSIPNTMTPFLGSGPTPGGFFNVRINRLQIRSGEELVFPKPRQEFRIFITGGSTAFGTGAVHPDQTIGAMLQKRLEMEPPGGTGYTFKVYTIANPAWSSTHERILIENRLSEWQPDLVISLSGNNDVHLAGNGNNVLWWRNYFEDFIYTIIKRVRTLAGQAADPEVVTVNPKPIHPDLVAQRLTKNVLLSSYTLALRKIDYLYFQQPTLALTQKSLTPREKDFLVNQKYFNLCYGAIKRRLMGIKMFNFSFADLSGCFDKTRGAGGKPVDIFVDSYHFGDRGNRIIAGTIYKHLKRKLSGRPDVASKNTKGG